MCQPVQIQHGSALMLWESASDSHRESSERNIQDKGFSEGITGRQHPQLCECAVGGVLGSSTTWFGFTCVSKIVASLKKSYHN